MEFSATAGENIKFAFFHTFVEKECPTTAFSFTGESSLSVSSKLVETGDETKLICKSGIIVCGMTNLTLPIAVKNAMLQDALQRDITLPPPGVLPYWRSYGMNVISRVLNSFPGWNSGWGKTALGFRRGKTRFSAICAS